MDETAIRQRIQDKLQQDELPVGALVSSDPSIAVNVGVGTGTPCSKPRHNILDTGRE
jgi:hypothetical protein